MCTANLLIHILILVFNCMLLLFVLLTHFEFLPGGLELCYRVSLRVNKVFLILILLAFEFGMLLHFTFFCTSDFILTQYCIKKGK